MSDLSLVQGGGSPGSTVPLPLAACQLPPWPPWHGHTKGPVPRVSWARGRWGGLDDLDRGLNEGQQGVIRGTLVRLTDPRLSLSLAYSVPDGVLHGPDDLERVAVLAE